MEDKGTFATLFDFSFTSFITTKVIKVLFAIGIIVAAIGSIGFIVFGFSQHWLLGVLFLVLSPIIFLIYVLFIRVYMEIIIFRIAENVQLIAASKTGQAPSSVGPTAPPPGAYTPPPTPNP